jgi:iron(III) transport system substrate-binding protein
LRSKPPAFVLRVLFPAFVVAGFLLTYRFVWQGGREPLVVYCAHDSIYSEKILRDFEKRTGVRVAIKFDTEATKSLGLVELLIREKDAPRCDVFWNNELLGTMDLKERGLLLPYKGPGHARIPAAFKDDEGHWTGFAARLRVFIINTDRMAATPEAVAESLRGDLARVAIAKPLYGTTLTHYSALWKLLGGEPLKDWHRDWRARGVRETGGNAMVKQLVADGACDLGLTDTDDVFVAKDEGKPVAMLPVRLGDVLKPWNPFDKFDDWAEKDAAALEQFGNTICIPNTVAIIKGTRKVADAQRLADFLLSAETELALANAKSRQVPLGPVDTPKLSADVRQLTEWARRGYPLSGLGPARAACLAWLKSEYVK